MVAPEGTEDFRKDRPVSTRYSLVFPEYLPFIQSCTPLQTHHSSVYRREVKRLEEKIKNGRAKRCFGTDFLQTAEVKKMTETQKLFVFGTLMEAGSDTSRVTLGQIIAGAVTSPDWVARARVHLDEVCGHNAERLPQWEDRPRLKYISAVVKEGFRWRPNIAEIGAPTMLIKDDEYEGYKFPAGTVFTWNAWAIALSPDEYKEPERFWPERFLNGEEDNALKGHWGFGPGKFSIDINLSLLLEMSLTLHNRSPSLRRLEGWRDERVDRDSPPDLLLRLPRRAREAH